MAKQTKTKVKQQVIKVEAAQEQQQPMQLGMTYTPDVLLKFGIEKGMQMDQLERLMAMCKEWMERKAQSLFLEAKSKFQGEVPIIKKNKNVSFETKDKQSDVDYNYAELGEIAKTIQPFIMKYGFSYDWAIKDFRDEKGDPKIKVTCIISHVAGHKNSTDMEAYHDGSGKKSNIQSRASAVSYLERYTLKAAFGLVEEGEDTDGKKAQAPPPVIKKQKITDGQFATLVGRAKAGEKVIEEAKNHFTLTPEQIETIELIENKNTNEESEMHQQGAATQ